MTGEPLVEGMLVGTPEHILSTSETHQVCEFVSRNMFSAKNHS